MKFLSYQEIRDLAPAAFAQEKADGLSDRYTFIDTQLVISQLGDLDWYPVQAYQRFSKRVKDPLHTTHQIVFRKLHPLDVLKVGDLIPQLIWVNDHRGRRTAELLSGIERLACLNGLVLPTGLAEDEFYQIHRGNVTVAVEAALSRAYTALEEADKASSQWRLIELDPLQQTIFAKTALLIRNPDAQTFAAAPLLERHRDADAGNDLWTVFNVVQENLTRGEVRGVFSRRRKLRKITGISAIQKLNQGLWSLAQRVADYLKPR